MGAFDDLIPQSKGTFDDLIPKKQLGPVEELSFGEKAAQFLNNALGGAVEKVAPYARGFVQGAADPVVGTAQLAANLVGQGEGINKAIADKEKFNELQGTSGGARFVGNLASPVNLAIAGAVPVVGGVGKMALQGAGLGAVGGAMQPITDGGNNYFAEKAGQTALGAVAGGVLTPVAGKIGGAIGDKLAKNAAAKEAQAAINAGGLGHAEILTKIDDQIAKSIAEHGGSIQDLAPNVLDSLRKQTLQAMQAGGDLDIAAALRKADFESLGMSPTLGQITRDPAQYARERNLSGVEGVGEDLLERFSTQRGQLADKISGMSQGAADNFNAGTQFSGALEKVDDFLRQHVSSLYKQAKASSGKDLDVPTTGLVQDYARIMKEYGNALPQGVRNVLDDFGFSGGTQTKIFNVDEAENVLKVINKNSSNDPAVNSALGEIRNAVKNAILSADDQGGVYANARKAASERFALHDTVPALKAAAEGKLAPDAFIQRYIIGGKTNEVKNLSQILNAYDPATAQQAKAQIGSYLERAAFGENVAGDKAFSQERFAKALRQLGNEKLSAFFSPDEIKQLQAVSRVGAYISSHPAASPVNTSGTGAMLMSMLNKVTNSTPVVSGILKGAGDIATKKIVVDPAMKASVPVNPVKMDARKIRRLGDLLGYRAVSTGGAVQ